MRYRLPLNPDTRPWLRTTLRIAGVYNMLWGALVVLLPGLFFQVMGMEQPLYPMIWQSVGMIVGVYGLGYWIAASDYLRHWPIVLVGFLGKVFGPIGGAWHIYQGNLPAHFFWVHVTNDLIWLWPFALMLMEAKKSGERNERG